MGRAFMRTYQVLASKELASGLFVVICLLSLPSTFTEERISYLGLPLSVSLGLMGLNLSLCTIRRLKTLPGPVLVMHGGVVLVLIGGIASAMGFVATVNVYEGSTIDTVYRWDVNKDMPLGANLSLKKINTEFYPIPVKVGVLKGEEKTGLFVLKTGESFNVGGYRVRVDSMEFPSEALRLSVYKGERLVTHADTSGEGLLPRDFPYKFVLVAFQNPSLKRIWLDLMLSRGADAVAEGTTEVNSPFRWEGLSFHSTQLAKDRYGTPYAGIQITKDPGKPYAYAGFGVMGLGAAAYLSRRLTKGKR